MLSWTGGAMCVSLPLKPWKHRIRPSVRRSGSLAGANILYFMMKALVFGCSNSPSNGPVLAGLG